MKKNISFVVVFILAFSMLVLSKPGVVNAGKLKPEPTPVQIPGLANGAWFTGTEVEINLDTAQIADLQLLTKGVTITEPVKLCHEFRGGDYGWVGEIRMLKNGVWVKQPTTQGWVPDTEGAYMACTNAAVSGTYALFGYYDAKTAEGKHIIELPHPEG